MIVEQFSFKNRIIGKDTCYFQIARLGNMKNSVVPYISRLKVSWILKEYSNSEKELQPILNKTLNIHFKEIFHNFAIEFID